MAARPHERGPHEPFFERPPRIVQPADVPAPAFDERRRERNDEAKRAFQRFLETVAVPLVRQVTAVLRAEGHLFTIFTPAAGVRMMSDRRSTDFVANRPTAGPRNVIRNN